MADPAQMQEQAAQSFLLHGGYHNFLLWALPLDGMLIGSTSNALFMGDGASSRLMP